MATYDDFDGVFFSVQSLRMFHEICNTDEVEFIILDGNTNSEHGKCCKGFIEDKLKQKYIPYFGKLSSFNKYETIKYAEGKYVLIIDCHVLIQKNGIAKLLEYFENNKNCKDLLQGPLIQDHLSRVYTHFDKVWRGDMYGIWATDQESYERGEPFEIPMRSDVIFLKIAFIRKNCHCIAKLLPPRFRILFGKSSLRRMNEHFR